MSTIANDESTPDRATLEQAFAEATPPGLAQRFAMLQLVEIPTLKRERDSVQAILVRHCTNTGESFEVQVPSGKTKTITRTLRPHKEAKYSATHGWRDVVTLKFDRLPRKRFQK